VARNKDRVKGPTQPRLTDRVRGRHAKLRQKELDAEKKAKEKDKKQKEKVDTKADKRAREREARSEPAELLCSGTYRSRYHSP
jgi:hypothetical protein